MNSFYSGAATLLAGASVLTFARFRSNDNTIEKFLRGTHSLSPACRASLDKVNSSGNPNSAIQIQLSVRDLNAIFWNSRLHVCVANRARLAQPDDMDLDAFFHIMQQDHAKVPWLLFLSSTESIVGRLGLGRITHYARVLLWTYGEELEILSQISEKCGPTERMAIQAIL